MKKYKIILGSIFCIGLMLGIYAFFIEPNLVAVNEAVVSVPEWDAEQDGLKIAILTDLHVGSPFVDLKKLEKIVSQTNALKPDVVVILGDFVIHGVIGGKFVEPEKIADVLKDLKSPIGTISVLGNHDWWYDGIRVRQAMEAVGIVVLENEVFKVSNQKQAFWLAGIADMWTRKAEIEWTLDKVSDKDPVIVLTHNPDIFPNVPTKVSLTLAGHTHGGQVNLPIVGRPVVPSEFGQRYAAGHIIEEGRHLFVGTGVGTSILPIRFRVVPEILVLTVKGI